MSRNPFPNTNPDDSHLVGAIEIRRTLQPNGDLNTTWQLTHGMTYDEAILALELTKLKLHYQKMKDNEQ